LRGAEPYQSDEVQNASYEVASSHLKPAHPSKSSQTKALENLTTLYHTFEESTTVRKAPADGSLKTLVTFDECKAAPVHRWYTFKEGYSHRLLGHLQQQGIIPKKKLLKLLDPFSGVATTLLSSQSLSHAGHFASAIGLERNPALRFIAKAKLDWHLYRAKKISALLKALKESKRGRRSSFAVPGLSTFTATRKSGKRAFEPSALQDLLFYRTWIEDNCKGLPEYKFFMLAWTAIVEQASNTRKDGRALRLLEVEEPPSIKSILLAQCELMLEDLRTLSKTGLPITRPTDVVGGDARRLPFSKDFFTAICYSPPYLNNIDYSEVYKLELWLRRDVNDEQGFYALRQGTLRSHPSVNFPATAFCEELESTSWIRRLKDALISSLPNDRYLRMRQALFSGYIDDMLLVLREQFRVAAPGAPIICVVGNSLHGGKSNPTVPVCTDLLIAAAARAVGLELDHLQIARQLPRRDNQNGWLRETIIVMRKPKR
jgi:hypothetical protein